MKSHLNPLSARDRIIVALDVPTAEEALVLVGSLSHAVSFYKIGLQLYTAAGPEIVRAIAATGAQIFLDLKLHDIPNTVAHAVESAGRLNVQMLTLHLSGGQEMIRAGVAAKPTGMTLLGVTVLTSATRETLSEIGVDAEVEGQVIRLAELGRRCGIEGLVTSPREVRTLRARLGDEVTLVTPGVRPAWAASQDQKRISTPEEALAHGADYLVVGRPITAAPEPRAAMERLLQGLSA